MSDGQTKKSSFVEAMTNQVIGYAVGILSQMVIFPLCNIDVPFRTNLILVFYFSTISLIRTYVVRRMFNKNVDRP